MKITKLRATFMEGLLGTKPNDEDIHQTYIASKREGGASKDELDAEAKALADIERLEKGMTIFHRDAEGRPMIWDYQIKGFLKDAIKALRRDPKSACAALKNYKGVIDGSVFVKPRQIVLQLPEGTGIGTCSRPLRASTPMGERVAIAKSEEAPPGTVIEFDVLELCPGISDALAECWEYAQLRFLGAWRNSGKGTAVVEPVAGPAKRGRKAKA